jgi:hypothetical protein
MSRRKYKEACEERALKRMQFAEAYGLRYERRTAVYYPTGLSKLVSFAEWLREEVGRAMDS